MRWLPAENELGSEQNNWLDNLTKTNVNESVIGFPGSGKTVLMVYAVIRLRKLNPNCRILIVEFTHALIKMLKASIDEVSKEESYKGLHIDDIEIKTYYDFFDKDHSSYDYIICDEIQDVPKKVISAMKTRAKRVIIAGDPAQSIYTTDPQWREPPSTLPETHDILSPHETKLTIIYRLTKRIINAVNSFLPNMKILAGRTSMIKTNVQIRIWKFPDQNYEVKQLMEEANSKANVNESVGILLRTHDQIVSFANMALKAVHKPEWEIEKNKFDRNDYRSLNAHLKKNGINMQFVANGYGNFIDNERKITLTTYHSSKGLDFDVVILPFVNNSTSTSEMGKRLFMVAMTRSRKDLYISFTSNSLNDNIKGFDKKDYIYKDWSNNLFSDSNNDDDFDFE